MAANARFRLLTATPGFSSLRNRHARSFPGRDRFRAILKMGQIQAAGPYPLRLFVERRGVLDTKSANRFVHPGSKLQPSDLVWQSVKCLHWGDGQRAPPICRIDHSVRADSLICLLPKSLVPLRLRILHTRLARFHVEYRRDPRIKER
jgi:hypothetical protein